MAQQSHTDDATDAQTEIAQSEVVLPDDVARELDDPIRLDRVFSYNDTTRGTVELNDGSVLEVVLTDHANEFITPHAEHITNPSAVEPGETVWERTGDTDQ
jgi:hypothetical protein